MIAAREEVILGDGARPQAVPASAARALSTASFFGWFTFLQTLGMAETDLKTSSHLFKHLQVGSLTQGT